MKEMVLYIISIISILVNKTIKIGKNKGNRITVKIQENKVIIDINKNDE